MTGTDGPENADHIALVAGRTDADSDGLFSVRADGATGALDTLDAIPAGESPKFLAVSPDGRRCYVVSTASVGEAGDADDVQRISGDGHASGDGPARGDGPVDGGSVLTVAVDPMTGALEPLSRAPSGGESPCYCSVDPTGRCVLVAHYRGGSVSVLPVDDGGRAGPPSTVVEHEGSGADPDRQAAPHPHAVVPGPDGDLVYVPDLGTDRVETYRLDASAGTLHPAAPRGVTLEPGSGPRHLAFAPDGDLAFLVGELDSTLTTLVRDPSTGALAVRDVASTLPADHDGENAPADVHVHPSGRWVYVSNRGHDSVALFAIEADRTVARGHESTRGSWPRDFALHPTGRYLYAENQHDDEIVAFAVDASAGTLSPTGAVLRVPRPGSMAFLPGKG